jgi:hypothetical protein
MAWAGAGRRRRYGWLGALLALACGGGVAFAQPPEGQGERPPARLLHYKSRAFRIPVTIPEEVRGLVREVRLWHSEDFGARWEEFGRTTPDRPEFPFRAGRDGEYWFALQTVDVQGNVYPSGERPVEPHLRVIVDTAPPSLLLESNGRRGSRAAVRWEVQDENLVLRTLTLEYQAEGAGPLEWRSVPLDDADLKLSGAKAWDAGTAEPLRVRASVSDRAKNARQVEIVLGDGRAAPPGAALGDRPDWEEPPPRVAPIASRSRGGDATYDDDPFASVKGRDRRVSARDSYPGGADESGGGEVSGFVPVPEDDPPASRRGGGSGDQTLLVGSPRFPLQYEVADAGPSGVSKVQLWVTHDGGRTWYPQAEDPDRETPYQVDLGGEGTFGLWLAVQGLSGLGDPPPAPGDRPQIWVEVDSTPPVVQVDPPRIGTGRSAGKVLVTWRASDPHLGSRPVHLSYRADGGDGPWTRIVGPIENTGQYIWVVPPGVPPRFRVRVEVDDTLGHRGAAETGPIVVDRARPKARIIGLDPSVRTGGVVGGNPVR